MRGNRSLGFFQKNKIRVEVISNFNKIIFKKTVYFGRCTVNVFQRWIRTNKYY